MRSKLVQGTKSITCEKRVRPEYMTVPRLKSQNRVRNYRQNFKPCSSRHQKKHPRNPYVAALFYKITLVEPDSTDLKYRLKYHSKEWNEIQVRGYVRGMKIGLRGPFNSEVQRGDFWR